MTETVSLIASAIALALGGGLAFVGVHAANLQRRLRQAGEEVENLQRRLRQAGEELTTVRQQLARAEPAVLALSSDVQGRSAEIAELTMALEAAQVEDEKKTGWLNHQQNEVDFLHAELEKRPRVTRKTYKVITVGAKWTGKTSLTLKWANPLIDLGTLQGTKIERYERTVSHVKGKDVTTEYVLEIGDWGGEHVVDALQEIIVEEIHGMLIVVDLGGKDANAVDHERIQKQLREFQPEALRFFFGPRMIASCKTVVLFINKSDLLSGTPAETEAQARKLYANLIDDLMRYKEQVDIRVLVGSASYGHSTHLLFSHFVEKILPKNAYDNQLLQRLKAEPPAAPAAPTTPTPPPLPPKLPSPKRGDK
jgi:hypothetical protein